MKKLFLSAVALMVLFAACSKDDDNTKPDKSETNQPSGKYILSQVSPFDSLVVTYDSVNKMKSIDVWDEKGKPLSTTRLVYENGKLTKVMEENDGVTKVRETLEYNSAGKLAKAKYYLTPNSDAVSNYDSLVYDADGRLAELYVLGPDHGLEIRHVYIWDNKGNIVRELGLNVLTRDPKDTTFKDYTYDDKVNLGSKQPEFFLMEPEDPTFSLSANNVVKSVGTVSEDASWSSVITYDYTYDQDGYPITRKDLTRVIQNGQILSSSQDSFKYGYITR